MFRFIMAIVLYYATVTAETCPPCNDNLVELPGTTTCLCECLAGTTVHTARLIPLLDKYALHHKISDTLLFYAWRNTTIRNNESLFAHILHLWKSQTPAPAFRLQELQKASLHHAADTLFTILDKGNSLDPFLLLRWIDTKIILDEPDKIPSIACRIAAENRELLPLATDKLSSLLPDLTQKQAARVIVSFVSCIEKGETANLHEASDWAIDQLGMLRAYADQLSLVRKHPAGSTRQTELLETISRELLVAGKPREACNAACAAFSLATDSLQKQGIAGIVYAAYQKLGKADSAVFWFDRSAEKHGKPTHSGIGSLLSLGKLDEAKKAINQLPESMPKDTLRIRYLLLADSPQVAFSKAFDEQSKLAHSNMHLAWRIRTALFTGKLDTCASLLKMYHPAVSDKSAPELLDYRLFFTFGEENPEMLAKFAQIEYTMYKYKLIEASSLLCKEADTSEIGWRLALRIARRLVENGAYKDARTTLECIQAGNKPEYLYCLADVLAKDGDTARARKLLQQILKDVSSGMYASQARLLLSKIGK